MTISSNGGANDFGDLTIIRAKGCAAVSNNTRGVYLVVNTPLVSPTSNK